MNPIGKFFKYLGMTAIGLFLGVICIYLVFGQYIDQYFNRLQRLEKMQATWTAETTKMTASRILADAIRSKQYAAALTFLRERKIEAEIAQLPKSEYVDLLVKARLQLPAPPEEGPWPYDLLHETSDPILYGLFREPPRRLEGEERRTELGRIADEIRYITGTEDREAMAEYRLLLEERYRYGDLTEADMAALEEMLGVADLGMVLPPVR